MESVSQPGCQCLMGWGRSSTPGKLALAQGSAVVGGKGDLSSTCLTTCYSCRQYTGGKNSAACLHLIPPCAATWTHNTQTHPPHSPQLNTASPFIIPGRPVRHWLPPESTPLCCLVYQGRIWAQVDGNNLLGRPFWFALTHLLCTRPRSPTLQDLRCCHGRHVLRYCGFQETQKHS